MQQLEPLFILTVFALVGFLSYRLKLVGANTTHVLNRYLINIGLPLLIFFSVVSSERNSLDRFLGFTLLNVIALTGAYFVSFGVAKLLKWHYKTTGAFIVTTVTANVAFFGLPIIQANYSKEHFDLAAVYTLAFSITISFVLLPMLQIIRKEGKLETKKLLKKAFINPLSIAVLCGLSVLVLKIELPSLLIRSLQPLGQVATPLSLFALGVFIASEWKLVYIKEAVFASVVKLIAMPVTIFLILSLIKIEPGPNFTISVLQAAMPTATAAMAIVDEYDLDRNLTTTIIILSSILFIPIGAVWMTLLK